jgi:2-dehydropantoate 2-reductase
VNHLLTTEMAVLQDVRAGKRTEIRDFNGWLVETAMYLDGNLKLPTHERLIDLVEDGITVSRSELGDIFGLHTNASDDHMP